MIWARYTDSELLWLFDTPRKLLGHTELISIQRLLHVGLHGNKLWSAGPAPGYQQQRAWPGAWRVCRAKVQAVKHPILFVAYLQKLCAVLNQDRNTPLATLLSLKTTPENNTLPRQKPWPLPDWWAENNTLPSEKLWKTYPWGRHIPSAQSIPRVPPRAPSPCKWGTSEMKYNKS